MVYLYRAIICILADTGCSLSEIGKILVKDIDVRSCVINFEGNNVRFKARKIHIPKKSMDVIVKYMKSIKIIDKPDSNLFNKKSSSRTIQKKINDLANELNLSSLKSRSFRDTFVLRKISEGMKLDDLVVLMGSTDTQRASRYIVYYEENINKISGDSGHFLDSYE
ncbi:site-specific integrase [Paenibacillus glucanolyticus]|uniref:site-specific integrase n=1 Tax=Paenibacillus glucanolyticus TaxID=59843 RepID=UPI002EDB29D7